MDQGVEEWQKELRVLLDLIKSHPSQGMEKERERVVVLEKLIAERLKHSGA